MDERHALRSGEVNLMDAQWTSPEAPAHEFARQDARQLELTPVNLVLATSRCVATRGTRPAFVLPRAWEPGTTSVAAYVRLRQRVAFDSES